MEAFSLSRNRKGKNMTNGTWFLQNNPGVSEIAKAIQRVFDLL